MIALLRLGHSNPGLSARVSGRPFLFLNVVRFGTGVRGALRTCGDGLECDACRYATKMAEQEDDACSRERFCRIVEHRWVELD